MTETQNKETAILENTLRSVADGNMSGGTVTATERMRAALALQLLHAARRKDSDNGDNVTAKELQLIVHLINGTGGLPEDKDWWENILNGIGGGIEKLLD